jgi:hypothetical protein
MGSVFRIGALLKRNDEIWSLPLTLTTETDPELVKLTESFKKQYRNFPPIDYWTHQKISEPGNTKQQTLKQLFEKLESARKHVDEDDPSLLKYML